MKKTSLKQKSQFSQSVSWLLYSKNCEIRQKKAFSPKYGNLFAYAANNPVHYTDPDGNQSTPFSLKDFLNLTNDPVNKIYNEMRLADSGDKTAQANLNYIFHEAGRETLKLASSTLNDMALVSLCIGLPEGATVFGIAATVCDGALAIDDFIVNFRHSKTNENYLDAFNSLAKDTAIIIAGFAYGGKTKSGADTISKAINITIGSTGRFYELGHRGAIKSEKALKKLVMKDIASGYFGQEVVPNAPLIIQEVIKAYKALTGADNEK